MTTFDELRFLADEASQRAEQAYHRLCGDYRNFRERTSSEQVSRNRFRTLARRVQATGTPFGAHTIVYDERGALLLVRHEGVGKWVIPGGGVEAGERFREAAERELDEEAGVDADYDGLAIANRIHIEYDEYRTWGVMPVFAARARSRTPSVDDPDGEISAAEWFHELPADTRDRDDLLAWRERNVG